MWDWSKKMGIVHHSCYSVTRSRTLVNFKEIIVHFSHHFQPLLGTRYLTFTPPDSDNTRAKGQKLAAVLNGLRSLREKEQNLYCESTYISKTINCISIYTHNKIKFFESYWHSLLCLTHTHLAVNIDGPLAPWIAGANSSRPQWQRLLVLQHLWCHVWTSSPSSPLLVGYIISN